MKINKPSFSRGLHEGQGLRLVQIHLQALNSRAKSSLALVVYVFTVLFLPQKGALPIADCRSDRFLRATGVIWVHSCVRNTPPTVHKNQAKRDIKKKPTTFDSLSVQRQDLWTMFSQYQYHGRESFFSNVSRIPQRLRKHPENRRKTKIQSATKNNLWSLKFWVLYFCISFCLLLARSCSPG